MNLWTKLAGSFAVGVCAGWQIGKRRSVKQGGYDKQFTGAFPRNEGAISAVTGGPPEDMNEMPATASTEGPIWDGHTL